MKGSIWMSKADWKRSWKPWLRGTALGFPFGTMPAGGAEIPTFLSYAIEKKLAQASGGIRQGRHRRRRRTRGGEQRVGHRHAGAAADARAADHGHRGDHARRVPAMGPAARAAAVRDAAAADLGPDRQHVRRQRDAADPEPAAGRHLGQAAGDPAPAALCRHPGLRHARRLRPAQLVVRPGAAVHHRRDRLPDAALRHSGRAGAGRHDPRPARRAAVPPRALDQPGRSVDLRSRSRFRPRCSRSPRWCCSGRRSGGAFPRGASSPPTAAQCGGPRAARAGGLHESGGLRLARSAVQGHGRREPASYPGARRLAAPVALSCDVCALRAT